MAPKGEHFRSSIHVPAPHPSAGNVVGEDRFIHSDGVILIGAGRGRDIHVPALNMDAFKQFPCLGAARLTMNKKGSGILAETASTESAYGLSCD